MVRTMRNGEYCCSAWWVVLGLKCIENDGWDEVEWGASCLGGTGIMAECVEKWWEGQQQQEATGGKV